MPIPPHLSPPLNDPAHVTRILRRHRPFMIAAAIAYGGLFAEEAWATTQLWPAPSGEAQLPIALSILLVALVGNGIAFLLPLAPEGEM